MPDFSHMLMVTDLDATFFSHPSRLSPRNVEGIEYFKAHGGRFTAATGRIPPNIRKAIPTCGTLFNAPAITANGAYIYDLSEDRLVRGFPLDAEAAREVCLFVQSLTDRVGMRISTESGILVNANRLVPAILRDLGVIPSGTSVPGEGAYVTSDGSPVSGLADPASIRVSPDACATLLPPDAWDAAAEPWYKIVFRGEPADLLAIRPLVEATFGDRFEYNTSSPRFYEMQRKGCNKASGLQFLASVLAERDACPIKTIAVGDQENDLPMLRIADISACPDNAMDEVKDIADHHLCHCDAGCIGDLVERLAAEQA